MNAQPSPKQSKPNESRRNLLLAVSLLLLLSGLWLRLRGGDSALVFASASMLRIGLVMGMLWLAWPSLRRPSQWLAPGMAAVIVLTLIVIAANPRLALVAIPAAGGLITIGAVIRAFRSSK